MAQRVSKVKVLFTMIKTWKEIRQHRPSDLWMRNTDDSREFEDLYREQTTTGQTNENFTKQTVSIFVPGTDSTSTTVPPYDPTMGTL